MPSKRASTGLIAAFAVISGFVATTAPASAASKEKVLYNFCCANGAIPSGVIFDAAETCSPHPSRVAPLLRLPGLRHGLRVDAQGGWSGREGAVQALRRPGLRGRKSPLAA